MAIAHAIAYCFGGALLTNAVPHFVAGLMGRAFQSPFAKPRGEGLSTHFGRFHGGSSPS